MALPASPSVVVLENNQSIFAPNVDSSIVGIVGFADKGPINEATLVTSQNDLLNKFGKPSSNIPGQGLEGAIEILEATNQVYFVRADNGTATVASATVTVGFCPAIQIPNSTLTTASSLYVAVWDNNGTLDTSSVISVDSTYATTKAALQSYFSKSLVNDAAIFADVDSSDNLYLVGRYAGSSAKLQVSSAGWTVTGLHASGPLGTGATNVTASGGTAVSTGASSVYALFETVYKGSGYNLSSLRDGSVVGLSVEVDSKSMRDNVTVNSDGVLAEQFLVEFAPSSIASIEHVLNTDSTVNQSNLVNVQLLASGSAFTAKDNPADAISISRSFSYGGSTYFTTPRFLKMIEGTYSVAGGNSGYSTTEEGSSADRTGLIGTSTLKTGLYALDDPSLNISIALVPGITHQDVQNALVTLAETTKEFLAVMAPPMGLDTTQEAVNWINGKETRTAALNSNYATVAWPWVQVYNYFAGADEWYDPAIFFARQCVYTDGVKDPWYAPAGYNRGRLTKPVDIEVRLNEGDKGALYTNSINPIVKEPQFGITIMGQKTTDRLPSALQSVNVRRLLIYIRKVLLQLGKPFQFEPNDEFTWELVEDAIRPFLDDLIARQAISEGAVKCDSTTNTPLRRDRKEMWCSVSIKPVLAAEWVVFEVNVTNQSATING